MKQYDLTPVFTNFQYTSTARNAMHTIDPEMLIIKLQSIFNNFHWKTIDSEKIDAYLDKRDEDPFDSEWSNTYEQVESQRKSHNSKKHLKHIDAANESLREWIFNQIIKKTRSPALASYLSDDFGLVFNALTETSITQFAAFHILEIYQHGALPSGQILVKARPSLDDLFLNISHR